MSWLHNQQSNFVFTFPIRLEGTVYEWNTKKILFVGKNLKKSVKALKWQKNG